MFVLADLAFCGGWWRDDMWNMGRAFPKISEEFWRVALALQCEYCPDSVV